MVRVRQKIIIEMRKQIAGKINGRGRQQKTPGLREVQGQYEVSKRSGKEESSGARPRACAETDK